MKTSHLDRDKVEIFDSSLEEFIENLEQSTIAKVLRIIDLLEEFGGKLGMPYAKKIRIDVFELRIRGKQEVRILYGFHKGKIVLLHGFVKKSQKIPPKEIQTALTKLRYLDRS